jgi:predicted TIM-barrel fold metal-dependent hydrolase
MSDNAEITPESVWFIRGTDAPSAVDFTRRLAVMDAMGSRRQLVFASFAILALNFAVGGEDQLRRFTMTDPSEALDVETLRALGHRGLAEHNEWAVRTTALDPDRLRAVALVAPLGSPDDLISDVTDLIERGIRGIQLPSSIPPAGTSPANPALDPLWALLAEADVPVMLHVSGEAGFLASMAWGNAPAFAPGKVESTELGLEPFSMATFHNAITTYVTAMVLGGVFERHPNLRFGAIECGAHWLGPLAENLDMWATKVFQSRLSPFLSTKPSDYVARNVRVTPFALWEDVRSYIERYPQLADCYCYSTDYPHFEGGVNSMQLFHDRLAPLGEEVVDKFFRRNGELLLPE